MKKILFLAIAIMAAVTSFAQTEEGTIVVMPRVGATMSNYNDTFKDGDISVDTKNHYGITAGAEIGYQVNKWFLPTFGVMYVNNGSKFELNKGNQKVAEINANWLAFPVMANFYVVKGLALKAGLQPIIMMNSEEKVSDAGMYFKLNTLDLQIPVGLSYELCNFILDARYNIGSIKLSRANYDPIDEFNFKNKFKNQYFTLTLGYKFKFKGPKLPNFPEE